MKLAEKIYYYRKKSGCSQEQLAEKIGVSRQAVSKWETGESEPEISKLKLLAEIFGITTDMLLSESAPSDNQEHSEGSGYGTADGPLPQNHYLGYFGRSIKKYSWFVGVYIALDGCAAAAIGGIMRYVCGKMFPYFEPEMLAQIPLYRISGIFFVIGIAAIIFGIILSIYLKHKLK